MFVKNIKAGSLKSRHLSQTLEHGNHSDDDEEDDMESDFDEIELEQPKKKAKIAC